jgi:hypothetical protein
MVRRVLSGDRPLMQDECQLCGRRVFQEIGRLSLSVPCVRPDSSNRDALGCQHLDFNDQGTQEEIRKINPAYANAISRDVADRGNALAEKIDAADGNSTASAVAKVLLMSSLSTAESPLRGLTDGELIETLVDPLLEESEIKAALGRLQGQAWYLFQGVDLRVFLRHRLQWLRRV